MVKKLNDIKHLAPRPFHPPFQKKMSSRKNDLWFKEGKKNMNKVKKTLI